jgi:mycoredoxin-dependent peroxiredoxin
MNRIVRIMVVVLAIALSSSAVYFMMNNLPASQANGNRSNPVIASGGTVQKVSNLSPNLLATDAHEFLDLLPVGKTAPEFLAQTAEGKPIRLSQYRNQKNVVLVFYQGSFCSVCSAQLSNIQQHLSDFRSKNTEVIAVSADDGEHAKTSVGENGLTFPVIPDEKKTLIKQYGVGNISKQGIAWPSLYIIDKQGKVAFSYADASGRRLHSPEILPKIPKS